MADIFISYKREDRAWAEALSRGLELQGWTTWWDTRLAAGESFDKEIERQLDAAKCVIVLWSKASVESRWVIAEAGEGLERDIIVPVFIEEVRPPLVFRRIQTARLIGWQKDVEEAVFVRLVADVSRILGPSPKVQASAKAREKEQERARIKAERVRQQAIKEVERKKAAERILGLSDKALNETMALPADRRRVSLGVAGLILTSIFLIWQLSPTPEPTGGAPQESTEAGVESSTIVAESRNSAFTNSIGMEFMLIEAGIFQMGSEDGDGDEEPVHEVRISQPFYLGKYEVTQSQWSSVMGTTIQDQQNKADASSLYGEGPSFPMYYVSWDEAQDFVAALNAREGCADCYRLPTEAEWEYAARADTSATYSFGDDVSRLGDYAWYDGNSDGRTHIVGEKEPNQWGLYDMHGNVWEWVQDWYDEDYYEGSPSVDPVNQIPSSYRVIRGGSWYNDATRLRSADRNRDHPGFRDDGVGFRLVRTYP